MQPSFSQLVASALLFLSTAQAHMVMKSPIPYSPQPNNSPLNADGSDFPCKQGSDPQYIVETENEITIGEPQTLSFTGSAVHGGGSCQVSLTTDRQPTKDSKWMVIKSIEGGCPSNVTGNLPADPNGDGAAVFEYTVPDGITPGKYTIAWSWINKIGNREFYMNCGPATISAPKKKRYVPEGVSLVRKQTSFPEIFVANLAGISDCSTPEGYDYNYPSPGDSVQSAGDGPYTQLTCNGSPEGAGGSSSPTTSAAGAGSTSTATSAGWSYQASASATATPSQSQAGSSAATAQASSQALGGVFGSGASPFASETASAAAPTADSSAAPTDSSATPTADSSAAPAADPSTAAGSVSSAPSATAASPAPSSTGTSGQQTPNTPCSIEGAWLCLGNAFQRCASGVWSVVIDLADGTNCTMTADQGFQIGADKRSVGKWVKRTVEW